MLPSGIRLPNSSPADWLAMTVWANQLVEVLGPVDRELEILLGVDLVEPVDRRHQQVGAERGVLERERDVGVAAQPIPESTLPSRNSYQRPISSSRAMIWATRLRSFEPLAEFRMPPGGVVEQPGQSPQDERRTSSLRPWSPPDRLACRYLMRFERYFRRFDAQAQYQSSHRETTAALHLGSCTHPPSFRGAAKQQPGSAILQRSLWMPARASHAPE